MRVYQDIPECTRVIPEIVPGNTRILKDCTRDNQHHTRQVSFIPDRLILYKEDRDHTRRTDIVPEKGHGTSYYKSISLVYHISVPRYSLVHFWYTLVHRSCFAMKAIRNKI